MDCPVINVSCMKSIAQLWFASCAALLVGWHSLRRRYCLVHVHNMPDFLVFSAVIAKGTGARVILARRPPRQGPVWVYKELGPTLACARAGVVGYTPAPGGAFSVRLRFETPCPAFVCQAVASGSSPARTEAAGA